MSAKRYDVLVVGGGAAGIAAAVAAARSGAHTRLVERYGFLGGMATAGMVGTICGLYHTGLGDTPRMLNEGIAAEVARRLIATGMQPMRHGRTVVLPYLPVEFVALADALVAAERSITVSLHTTCAGASVAGRQIESVRLVSWRGAEEVGARIVVDTSGDAIVASLAGAPTETPDASRRQLCSLIFVMQSVDEGTVGGVRTVAVLRALRAAETDGTLPAGCAAASFRPSGRPGEVLVKLSLDGLGDGADDALTHAEQVGRQRVASVAEFLTSHVAGFRHAFVSHVAPQVGVRESRRMVGRETLTRADVLAGRKWTDGLAHAAWPIELWEPGGDGARYEYLADDDWYDVPQGCVESGQLVNLLGAGRCMSATHEAMGSARVIGTCLAVGEAVGRLAAARAGT